MKKTTLLKLISASIMLTLGMTSGASASNSSCYQQLNLEMPKENINKALYIFIDQTMPLNTQMRSNLSKLLSSHPKSGEQVSIVRFSPNVKGQYTELSYEGMIETQPSDAYLYQLRDKERRALQTCIKKQKHEVKESLRSAIKYNLALINTKLPRTELLHALKHLSETVLANNPIEDKTILIISDGMENSELTSFYRRRSIARIDVEKEMSKVNSHNLLADWRGAKLYMFGLGNIKDERKHVKPSQLEPLKAFWEHYFMAGGAVIKELGTPAILSRHL